MGSLSSVIFLSELRVLLPQIVLPLQTPATNAELSEFFWRSLSSAERAQRVPLSLRFLCQSELTELLAELTD